MILTPPQASTVRAAMVLLNNIGARVEVLIPYGPVVYQRECGTVQVIGKHGAETYPNQTDFFEAYDSPQNL